MNYQGSYRHLLRNSISALISAIEIYNKPKFDYRNECFAILLLNSWELILKALLSKRKQSIFYRKKRDQLYRTLSWSDALNKAQQFFPNNIDPLAIRKNLELLSTYRDNAVHFYNQNGFKVIIYALAQTAIVNYRDLLSDVFGKQLENEINWELLPIGIKPPINPIEYISKTSSEDKVSSAVTHFLSELKKSLEEVNKEGKDTGRIMTIFNVKLESVKKIEVADIVIGVKGAGDQNEPLTIVKPIDPNITHPLRRKDVVEKISSIHGIKFTPYIFDAIIWKYNIRSNSSFCWQAREGILTRYSNDIVPLIDGKTKEEVEQAINEYKKHIKNKRKGEKSYEEGK